MVEKDVVDAKARKGIQTGANDRIVQVMDVAPQIKVGAAPRHRKLQHQQRAHQIGNPALGEQGGQPEEGRAEQIKGVGVHDAAAQIGGPGEGVGGQPLTVHRGEAVRIALALHKAVHIVVKADLLAVEVPSIVEKAAVNDLERQENQRRRQGAQPHRQPEAVPLAPQQGAPGWMHEIHSVPLFSAENLPQYTVFPGRFSSDSIA